MLAGTALAQDYPNRPVRLLTPYGAGGSYDGLARVMADKLSRQLGQQVIVDNRPGAAGRIGMALGAKAAPDGYTLLMIGNTQTIVPSVHGNVPYDLDKDFDGLSMVAIITNVLVINPAVPAKSVQEFVSLAKAKPGALRFGSGGTGGITHLAGELFKSMTGTNIIHVPYKSGAARDERRRGRRGRDERPQHAEFRAARALGPAARARA